MNQLNRLNELNNRIMNNIDDGEKNTHTIHLIITTTCKKANLIIQINVV